MPALVKALRTADPEQQAAAAGSLGRISDPTTFPALLELAKRPSSQRVRIAAIEALGRIGDVRGLPVVDAILSNLYYWQGDVAKAAKTARDLIIAKNPGR